ncbi:uncharacterized protein BO66DRAFT_394522 [Aspergillus aculeatinus CBS 121060]|uniref:Uncharacterized protein n=1 Tax=Aspergillus aculeatinus CBS 121060 TaxID=1448322 RepID=A0ACD1GZG2_9EURO|nr:hypothetical protein BO66DRAFT_394522 [Aspergillus aculeatinus CBS 121060]RAH66609.1 hypothetical protein BO66DRAFT_394522 [Aspergillus aculeatinus CBS 121060]
MAGAGRGSKRRSDAKTLSACGFLVSVIGGGACKILPGWAGYSSMMDPFIQVHSKQEEESLGL